MVYWSWALAGALAGGLFVSAYLKARDIELLPQISTDVLIVIKSATAVALGATLVWLAAAEDSRRSPQYVLGLQATLLGGRFEGLAIGFMAGMLTVLYSRELLGGLERVLEPAIASSSWPLPAVVGTLLIVALVLVLNPDLIGRIESFKAGELEAKFVQKSSGVLIESFV